MVCRCPPSPMGTWWTCRKGRACPKLSPFVRSTPLLPRTVFKNMPCPDAGCGGHGVQSIGSGHPA